MDQQDFSTIEVEDGENYSSQKELSKEQVILKALQRCLDEGAREMTDGGIITRVINGVTLQFPSINQKEVLINSIRMFWGLVMPIIIKKHKDWCKQELGDFTDDLNELNKGYREEKTNIKKSFDKHKNLTLFVAEKNELKGNYENELLDLYRGKLDFGIMVIDKENWFGERSA